MRINQLLALSIIATLCLLAPAEAAPPTISFRLWTSSLNKCTVAEESAAYDTRLVGLGFASGTTGTIRAYCAVDRNMYIGGSTLTGLALSYKLPNGNTGGVSATVWRVPDGSSTATAICTVTGAHSAGGLAVDTCAMNTAMTTTHSYVIEVVITRSNTTVDPEGLAVFIYNT